MRGLEGWERSGAGGAGANGNLVVNGPGHHGQNLLGNFGHVMRGGDVIHSLGENFLFGIAASFKPATRNEVVTEKNFCHWGTPEKKLGEGGRELSRMLTEPGSLSMVLGCATGLGGAQTGVSVLPDFLLSLLKLLLIVRG